MVCRIASSIFVPARRMGSLSLNHLPPKIYSQPEPDFNDEIVISMSSGVDSSVTAASYASKFSNVKGIYMANWSQTAKCTESDWNDVQRVCEQLEIPCERVNFEKEYWNNVFEPMIENYKKGITPNPDIGCNKYVKFGSLIQYLTEKYKDSQKKWWLATGHYARIMRHNVTGETHLLKSYYPNKDQSYYLSMLPSSALEKILMPIGHYTKPEIRDLAKNFNLHTAEKRDSQGLCFVSQTGNFRDFLNEYIEPNPGDIILEDGTVVGKHKGIWHATVGQRSGFSMPQGNPAYRGVWYVKEKRLVTNEIVIVKDVDNPALFSKNITASDWSWIGDMSYEKLKDIDTNELQVRYRSLGGTIPIAAFVVVEVKKVNVVLRNVERAIAPGQNLVLYHNNRLLGAGTIDSAF